MKPLKDNWMSHLDSLPLYPAGKRLNEIDDRFWASQSSDNRTCVIVDLSINVRGESTGEIIASVESHRDAKRPTLIIYRLLDERLRDKFLVMFAAISTKSRTIINNKLINHITQQILEWAAFLSPKRGGLSDKALQGLWGELYFIKTYLTMTFTPELLVEAYTGIRGKPQDLTTPDFYVEIKTTLTHAPRVINISSLEQLDPLFSDQILVLILISPTVNGLSLLDLMSDIELSISDNTAALYEFKKLVSNATQEASEQQLQKVFKCLNVLAWEIRDDFPSLRRSRVDSAILLAKYDLQVSVIESFRLAQGIEEWINARRTS